MTFQPGDIVVCVSNGFPNGWLVCGTVYTVERVDFWVYLKDVAGGWCLDRFRLATDEEKKQFLKGKTMKEQKIEGIPEGWELVRIGKPEVDEWVISTEGKPLKWMDKSLFDGYAIIRKIEKPKEPKEYRPFANHAEARSFWNTDVRLKGQPETRLRIIGMISSTLVQIGGATYNYEQAFEMLEFADGSPFGVEVTNG
jgi:hypothetical protein